MNQEQKTKRSTHEINPTQVLEENQYLSALPLVEDMLSKFRNNYVIVSPTNTGKTTAVIDALKKTGTRFVFAVDCIILASQLHEKYKKRGIDIPMYFKGLSKPTGSCITLYNHVPQFEDRDTVLIVDEFHSLVKDYSYKKIVIDGLMSSFSQYRQVIGLTGTSIGDFPNFKYIIVEKKREERNIQLFPSKTYINDLVHQIVSSKDKIHYISLFNKDADVHHITATLCEYGIHKEEIVCINAETKDNQAFQQLIAEERIDHHKVIFTTYTQGFNIKGNNYMLHIIPKTGAWHSLEDIEQVVNRFRDETPIINLYWEHEQNSPSVSKLDENKVAEQAMNEVRKVLNHEKNNRIDFDGKNSAQSQLMQQHVNEATYRLLNQSFTVSFCGVYYTIHENKTMEMFRNLSYMADNLKTYGYNLLTPEQITETEYSNRDEKVYSELIKHKESRLRKELLELYEQSPLLEIAVNSILSERFKYLLDYVDREEAYKLLSEILHEKKAWSKLKLKIVVQNPYHKQDKKILKHVYSTFQEGESYTSEEINILFNKISEELDTAMYGETKTKNTQSLKNYFKIRRTKKMIEDSNNVKKVVNAYHLLERINQQESAPVEATPVILIQKTKKIKKHQDSIALNSDSEK